MLKLIANFRRRIVSSGQLILWFEGKSIVPGSAASSLVSGKAGTTSIKSLSYQPLLGRMGSVQAGD